MEKAPMIGGARLFLLLTQDRQYLSRDWNHTAGGCCFRRVCNPLVPVFRLGIVTGLSDGQFAVGEVYVRPFQGKKLSDSQSRVKAEDNTEHLWAFIRQHCLFNLLLFGRGECFS